eukprot:CAMPEP_0176440340 /NCGR_PEP_ID=MMETSP0127-20121128/20508_1 /TAXON_ID=938130 /ORGANISM="Platyophrya macrostoma, Strain WH" /LENGTH=162 /DNA_ID=CAMNT_0017824837 /DNA_START=206 /DNA_END=694 /DNA_ORIENTATION=+
MSALNAQMSLQQLAYQRPEQLLIAELMRQNELLQLQVHSLTLEKEKLAEQLEAAQGTLKSATSQEAPTEDPNVKKKRFRRVAKDIARDFRCPVSTCGKCYGSEGSLHQHLRLKHPDKFQELKLDGEIISAKLIRQSLDLVGGSADLQQGESEARTEKSVGSQ